MISVGGIIQNPGVDYTTTGSQIIFTTAPASGLSFFGTFLGDVGNGVSSSSITYQGTGTGAVSRLLTSKVGDIVSVKDFGAVGDGVTNDTAAIQAAVTSANTTGKTLFFPVGTYLTSGQYSITTEVLGESLRNTTVKKSANGGPLFTVSGNGSLRNLTINGNGFTGTGVSLVNPSYGTYVDNWIDRVRITGVGNQSTPTVAISGITAASPPVVTATSHDFVTGDLVTIAGVTGLTSTEPGGAGGIGRSLVEGVWRITKINNNSFSLNDLNATGYTAYSSGGTAQKASFGLTIQKGNNATATRKTITNVVFDTNYAHLFVDWSILTQLSNISMYGQVVRDGIYLGLGVNNLYFDNLYTQACGIRTAAYGIREVHFTNTAAYLRSDLGTWNYPWFSSLAFNSTASIGGEVAGISFNQLHIQRTDLVATPLFDINNYQITLNQVKFELTGNYSGKGFILDRNTYDMSLQNLTIDGPSGTWDLFHPSTLGSLAAVAININYTQGSKGTITWGGVNESGIACNRITVINSNLNQKISALNALSCRAFHFENIFGNVDLTNANNYGTFLRNIYGTVTDVNNSIGIGINMNDLPLVIKTVYTYANNAAALAAGRVVGEVYKTSTGSLMTVY